MRKNHPSELVWKLNFCFSCPVISLHFIMSVCKCSMVTLFMHVQEEISGWREDLFTARKSATNLLGVIAMSKVGISDLYILVLACILFDLT